MKTETSKRSIIIRNILILPLVAILVFGFSTTEEVVRIASPDITSENIQEKASKAQVAEYNKLAKKYNDMPADQMFVQKRDVERLKYLYGIMNDKQRSNAQPFPKFPPMPAPPTPPKSPNDDEVTWVNVENTKIPPPPPVVSIKPIDHIVRMVDENAMFFFENKKISSNKAVALVKENNNLNIETTRFSKSNPIVKITKASKDSNNIWMEEIDGDIPPPPPPPESPKAPEGENEFTYAPPPINPSTPPAPLPAEDPAKIILEMAEKGATFFVGTKEIDSKEAIEIVRKNEYLKIDVENTDSDKPIVRLIGC